MKMRKPADVCLSVELSGVIGKMMHVPRRLLIHSAQRVSSSSGLRLLRKGLFLCLLIKAVD